MVYMVYQMEVAPTTGQQHWQGCVKFKQMRTMNKAKELIGYKPGGDSPFMEICRDWNASKEYCQKDDTRSPGTSSHVHGQDVGQGQRTDLEAVNQMITAGASIRDIAVAQPLTYMRYHRGIQELRLALQQPPAMERKAVLIIGATGVGKTRFVMDNFRDVYTVFDMRSPWFDGYDGQTNVLLDECGTGMMHYNILKQLTDRYPFRVPRKGGSAPWMAKNIFLTSNEPMRCWYPNLAAVHLDALERRIKTFCLPMEHTQLLEYMKDELEKPEPAGAAAAASIGSVESVSEVETSVAAAESNPIDDWLAQQGSMDLDMSEFDYE